MFRFRLIYVMVMIFAFAVAGMSTAAQEGDDGPARVGLRPDAPTYALHGPYWVGTRQFVIEPESERPLSMRLWYPAAESTRQAEAITYEYDIAGHAIAVASPNVENGPYPLVIYAHGGFGNRFGATYLTEHLPSWGFVVMAVDFADNWETNAPDFPVYSTVYSRPHDVVRQLDFAASLNDAGRGLDGLIDTTRVAIIGHSWGGYTAYAASGARLDLEWFSRLAADHPEACIAPAEMGAENWCARTFFDHQQEIADLAGLDAVPDKLWPSWGDSRIDAMIGFAPDGYGFGPEGLSGVDIPVMLMTGSMDRFNPAEFNVHQPYGFLGSAQKSKVVLEGGDHLLFATSCKAIPWAIDMGLFWFCSDPVWDMDRAHDLINHFTTAFLLDVLKGDAEAHAALLPDAVSFPGIIYETTMQ